LTIRRIAAGSDVPRSINLSGRTIIHVGEKNIVLIFRIFNIEAMNISAILSDYGRRRCQSLAFRIEVISFT
jgi:hypothetical protein